MLDRFRAFCRFPMKYIRLCTYSKRQLLMYNRDKNDKTCTAVVRVQITFWQSQFDNLLITIDSNHPISIFECFQNLRFILYISTTIEKSLYSVLERFRIFIFLPYILSKIVN